MNAIRIPSRLGGTLLLLVGLVLGGCASGGMGAGGEGSTAVQVQNNLIPPTSLSIYAVPEIGGRRLVGVVEPGASKTLRFDPTSVGGQYQFVAETTAGREIVSNPVTLSAGSTVRWDLSANIATITSQ